MQSLFEIIPQIKQTTATSQRAELIGFFLEEINKERPTTYKNAQGKKITLPPITARAVALKLGHVKNLSELQHFLSECKDYRSRNGSFSKRFFGGLKLDNAIYLEKDNEKK